MLAKQEAQDSQGEEGRSLPGVSAVAPWPHSQPEGPLPKAISQSLILPFLPSFLPVLFRALSRPRALAVWGWVVSDKPLLAIYLW